MRIRSHIMEHGAQEESVLSHLVYLSEHLRLVLHPVKCGEGQHCIKAIPPLSRKIGD